MLWPGRFLARPALATRAGSLTRRFRAHNGDVSSLTGKLLVAVPRPHDREDADIFARSVVFVLHHGDEGAQGLVLTCPLEAGVDSVLPGWQSVVSAPDRLFQGGPVDLDRAICLANVPGHDETLGAKRLFGSLSVVDLDAPPELLAGDSSGIRIFAGSAGWSPGQLDAELAAHTWVAVEHEVNDVFDPDPATLWQRVLTRQPWPLRLLVSFPADPTLN